MMVSAAPKFVLEPPPPTGKRFRLLVTNPGQKFTRPETLFSNLCFRISSKDKSRLVGTTSYRNIVLGPGELKYFEIGTASFETKSLDILIEDISWRVYGVTERASPIELHADDLRSDTTYTDITDSTEGGTANNEPEPPLAEPGDDRALADWTAWCLNPQQRIAFGSAPSVMVSFARQDQQWCLRLEQHLRVAFQRREDPRTRREPISWSYRDGIRAGDNIHRNVVRAMAEARAAIVLISPSYFSSHYCHGFELPFLLWRMVAREDITIRVVRVTHLARLAPFKVTDGNGRSVLVDLDAIADDRVASPLDDSSRNFTLEELAAKGDYAEVDRRFARIAEEICGQILL
jgi:TIR domain-containing protein